ncbi:zincin-like metallopeptidase domain-containing protein, partial [Enterococcus faecium]|uniref:zincin-like metallopeptidase domain-containing protein n=1 Tax=Enterococcus faecium TaxID=1352 RepID=UPI0034E98705
DGTPNEKAERIIANLPWNLKINEGLAAFWSPSQPDAVTMPKQSTFHSMEEWYATLFHEVGHATGHSSKLDRDMAHHDTAYSFEELVAEFTAAMLCAHCGIDNTMGNTASYIA